jgi:hypothetical protein
MGCYGVCRNDPSRIGHKMKNGNGFEYDEKEGKDFIGIYCQICDREIGYEACPECEEEQ